MNAPLQVPRNKRSIDDQATPPLPRPAVCFGWSAALTPTITPTITPRTPWPSLPLPAHIRISLNSNTPPPPTPTHTPTYTHPAPLRSTQLHSITTSSPCGPPSLSALSCATLLPNQMRKWLVWWLTDSGLARKDKWPKVLEFNTLTKPTWSAGLMLEKIHLWKNKRCVCVCVRGWFGLKGEPSEVEHCSEQRPGNQKTGTDLSHPVKNENPHLQTQSLIKPHEEFHCH